MLFSENKRVRELLSDANNKTLETVVANVEAGDSRDFKTKLSKLCKMMPYLCGDDLDLKNALKPLEEYCGYEHVENYSYDKESILLRNIFLGLQEYDLIWEQQESDVDKAIEKKYSKKGEEDDVVDADKSGVRFLTTKMFVENSKMYTLKIGSFFDMFVPGILTVPEDIDEKDAFYGIGSRTIAERDAVLKMPLFAHLPVPEDINDHSVEMCPGLNGFRYASKKDYKKILEMMCDNDDGTVWVRVFVNDENGQKPVYVKLGKIDTYLRWVLKERNECLWSGLIVSAFKEAGLDPASMNEDEFIRHCLGEDYSLDRTPDELKDDKYYENHFRAESILEYAKFIYDVYASMLATAGYNFKMQEEFVHLGLAVQELLNCCPRAMEMPKDMLKLPMEKVREGSDNYRAAYIGEKGKRNNARKSICITLNRLYEIYCSGGTESDYPYTAVKKEYARKVAAQIYQGTGRTYSAEELGRAADSIAKDECFEKAVSNMKAVALCTASDSQIAKTAARYRALKSKKA